MTQPNKIIKTLNKPYYIVTLSFWIIFIGMFTLYKPIIVNEYERCYICNGEPCDCKIIKETKNNAPVWYLMILLVLAAYVIFFSVYRLLEMQKERLGKKIKSIKSL